MRNACKNTLILLGGGSVDGRDWSRAINKSR